MQMRTRNAAAILCAALVMAAFLQIPVPAFAQTPAKLLLSQVEVRGGGPTTPGEYIVIKNPGSSAVDLSDYYLTDATFASGDQFYYNLPDASKQIGGGNYTDFVARFPDGATIAPGDEMSIAVNGSDGFFSTYGVQPDFELYEDGASADGIPDMRPARPGSINETQDPSLSNSGEVVILFYWDGQTDLVTDIDYVVWGDKEEAVDKTGVSIDGPDADTAASTYQADTPIASQDALAPFGTPAGTFIRIDDSEGTQKTSGGNGVAGRDETSENISVTFSSDTDGTPPGGGAVDTTPPTLLSAAGAGASASVSVTFSEAVGTGAGTASNYSVYPTASPSTPITVTAASAASGSGALVTLTLASPLAASTQYTVRVSNVQDVAGNAIAANSTVSFTTGGGSGGGLQVAKIFQFGPKQIAVAFSAKVNAPAVSNFTVTPQGGASAVTVQSVVLNDNGQTAILNTAANLPLGATYGVAASGVTGQGGGSLEAGGPTSFTTVNKQTVAIADIQANSGSYDGQTVSVIGQAYIPVLAEGSHFSGYIQDGSGRGLNVYETAALPTGFDGADKVGLITGTVDVYFTTVELTAITASSSLATGVPPLAPKVLSLAQAKSSQWEGTYIQTTATLTEAPVASGSYNYNFNSGDFTFRVRNLTGISPSSYNAGDTVTGAGAGGAYQSTFQILVGNASDFFKGSGGGDTTPPTLASASGTASQVSVTFSEAVGDGAGTASNYTVYPTASPSTPVTVTAASASGSTVTLTLASALTASTSYTVRVSNVKDLAGNTIAANSTVSFTSGGSGGGDFKVAGIYQFGPRQIAVAFTQDVNAAQATQTSHYALTPTGPAAAISLQGAAVQDNGQTVILTTVADLGLGSSYTVAVTGLQSRTGEDLVSGGPSSFTTVNQAVTGIDEIQQNAASFDGQSVTIIGQVYIATGSGTTNAYIQDGTGRGLNVFGSGSPQSALTSRGNVVLISGTVSLYFTTTELTSWNATLLASNQPFLAPKSLTVQQAQSSQWEGTYIQTTSTLTAEPSAGTSTTAVNYPAEGITFRVLNSAGINSSNFHSGDVVTAAGAGSQFQSSFQILVGNGTDFSKGGGPGDTTPPTLNSASSAAGGKVVTLIFSEPVGAGANQASNYSVYEAQNPSQTVGVTAASVSAATVNLTLATALTADTQYTVSVSNVQDLAGNTIAANSTYTFAAGGAAAGPAEGPRVTVPARTLVKGLKTADGVMDITLETGTTAKAICRIFDLQGRLVRVLYDGNLSSGTPTTVTWDGRDQTFELVRAGMYICHLMTTDTAGRVRDDHAPIVVSARLD